MRFSARRTSVLLPAGDGGQGHFSRATGRDRAWTRTAAILATGRLVDRVRRQRDRTVREGRNSIASVLGSDNIVSERIAVHARRDKFDGETARGYRSLYRS